MPTLMTVTGLEIELEPNRSYTLGRALSNDIVIEDMLSSRNHAMLTVRDSIQQVFIEDLKSRNGTWVNEVRVARRSRLTDGASIRIGATVYLLNLLDNAGASMRRMLETGTLPFESLASTVQPKMGPTGTDFAGQLGSFGLVEILQLLTLTRRSGTLHLALPEGHAKVELTAGEVDAAEFDNLSGFDALVALAGKPRGLFWLVSRRVESEKTIDVPASRLLLELCSAMDEAGA
ncbi:MAG: FHA domain-containing protein [Planctomycetes bacterium]|nr:FHA domain-containing protein [Planctomycetota bacterium]